MFRSYGITQRWISLTLLFFPIFSQAVVQRSLPTDFRFKQPIEVHEPDLTLDKMASFPKIKAFESFRGILDGSLVSEEIEFMACFDAAGETEGYVSTFEAFSTSTPEDEIKQSLVEHIEATTEVKSEYSCGRLNAEFERIYTALRVATEAVICSDPALPNAPCVDRKAWQADVLNLLKAFVGAHQLHLKSGYLLDILDTHSKVQDRLHQKLISYTKALRGKFWQIYSVVKKTESLRVQVSPEGFDGLKSVAEQLDRTALVIEDISVNLAGYLSELMSALNDQADEVGVTLPKNLEDQVMSFNDSSYSYREIEVYLARDLRAHASRVKAWYEHLKSLHGQAVYAPLGAYDDFFAEYQDMSQFARSVETSYRGKGQQKDTYAELEKALQAAIDSLTAPQSKASPTAGQP